MADTNRWEAFFDTHAPDYNDNVFTKNTQPEVDFLVEELALPPGSSILDVGCGTGRHAVELAKRGFRMTGLDLSRGMLAQGKAAADAAGVDVEWVHADATRFSFPGRFDAAICLCEGSIGLLGREDDPIDQPLAVLRNISRSLKPGAKAVLTVLNAARHIRMYSNEDVAKDRYDPLTMVESSELAPREGLPAVPTRERGFVPTELRLLCRLAGLSVVYMGGGTAGRWGKRPIDLDEFEIMLVVEKTGEPIEFQEPGAHRRPV